MKCVSCDRTLSAGGSTHPMAVGDIETMFAELLGWQETVDGWRCAECSEQESSMKYTIDNAPKAETAAVE